MNKFLLTVLLLASSLFSVEIIIDEDLSQDEHYYIKYNILNQKYVVVNGLMWQDDADAKTVIKDWESAKQYCNNLVLGGYDDWYLSSKDELLNIVNKNRKPTIKEEFTSIASSFYWSSSKSDSDSDYAWYVSFNTGESYNDYKEREGYLRCVRKIK